MMLEKLLKILPPPAILSEAGDAVTWPSIDDKTKFPNDYIEFVRNYGLGRISNFISFFHPFTSNFDLNFFEQKKIILEDFEFLNKEQPDSFNYVIYPQENGLLPIGVTDNGDYIFWVVNDSQKPELWTMAIVASRSPDIEYFDKNLTNFLYELLNGDISPESFPKNYISDHICFETI